MKFLSRIGGPFIEPEAGGTEQVSDKGSLRKTASRRDEIETEGNLLLSGIIESPQHRENE